MEVKQLTEKDTQSENRAVNIQFLKLRAMLWTITVVSSFIGFFLLILRVVLYPQVFNAWVLLIMITDVLIFLRSGKACEELDKELNNSK